MGGRSGQMERPRVPRRATDRTASAPLRNPMRNIRTAAKMIVRAHERAFKELEKF